MHRAIELAQHGAGYTAPNPLVGAVLVHNDYVIGEGWHQRYGQAHAEVNCINDAIAKGNGHLLSASTLYVTLEPCAHFGKTPPCADLIIRHHIPFVYIGCRDPFPLVDGKGIEKLQQAGIQTNILLEKECRELNKRFFCFHEKKRPYIILKWARTADNIIGVPGQRLLISNSLTNQLVHRWRSAEAAILVGTKTAAADDPQLTNRSGSGPNPIRIVIDNQLQLPPHLHLFDRSVPTLVFNQLKESLENNLQYLQYDGTRPLLPQLCSRLYEMGIQSLLVEGGAQTLQAFIDTGYWDEALVITNTGMQAGTGINGPQLSGAVAVHSQRLDTDEICYYRPEA